MYLSSGTACSLLVDICSSGALWQLLVERSKNHNCFLRSLHLGLCLRTSSVEHHLRRSFQVLPATVVGVQACTGLCRGPVCVVHLQKTGCWSPIFTGCSMNHRLAGLQEHAGCWRTGNTAAALLPGWDLGASGFESCQAPFPFATGYATNPSTFLMSFPGTASILQCYQHEQPPCCRRKLRS